MSAPVGAKRLVVAQGLLGLGSYAMLVAAGRTLDSTGFAAFAVFWSVVFSFGLGLFGPLELILLRLAALRRSSADHVEIPRLVGWYLWIGLVAATAAAVFLYGSLDGATGGATLMAAAGFGYFLLLRTLAIQRGVSAGRGDYPRYARQVGTDGVARLVLAAALLLAGATWAGVWAMAVGVSGFAGALAARRQAIGPVSDDPASPHAADDARKSLRDVLTLTAGTTLSVILANSLPTAAVASGSSGAALAGFSAVVLVSRIPLFFSGLGQAVVVPRVARLGADEHRRSQVERQLLGMIAVGSSAVGVLVGLLTGPVVAFAFPLGAPPTMPTTWLLALSTGALLFALVGQGILLGRGTIGAVAAVWVSATAIAIATLILAGGSAETQVALASALSSVTAGAVLLIAVARRPPPGRAAKGMGRGAHGASSATQ